MRSLILALTITLTSCTSSLLGPEDQGYEALCVLEVWAPGELEITRRMIEGCEQIEIYVYEFWSGGDV